MYISYSVCCSATFLPSYLTIYGLILLGSMICYTTGSYVDAFGAQRASRSIHRELIEAVLGTTLSECPYRIG